MAAASISVTRVSSSCLLPLQEAFQDKQICRIQAPFKVLLLNWVQECVRFCVYPLWVSLYFSQPSDSTENQHPLLSKPNILRAHLLGAGPLGWGTQCGYWTPLLLGEKLSIVIILLFVAHLPGGIGLEYSTSMPLLLISLWFLLYIFSCRRFFSARFQSFLSIVSL